MMQSYAAVDVCAFQAVNKSFPRLVDIQWRFFVNDSLDAWKPQWSLQSNLAGAINAIVSVMVRQNHSLHD